MCGLLRILFSFFAPADDGTIPKEEIDGLMKTPMIKSGELSDSEKTFREKRSLVTMKAIQDLLGPEGPKSPEETPTVALVISGGGYRAVSTSCGAMEALMENGIFDALMYCVGLSGSVWYLSSMYTKKSFSSFEQLKDDHDWLRGQLGKELNFNAWTTIKYAFKSLFMAETFSLTDVFGSALKDVFFADQDMNVRASSLKGYVQDGKVPLPIFTAAHVMNNYPTSEFWEEIEISPFEATFAPYHLIVPVELMNSVWKNGIMSRPRDEPMLHYVMGVCGCAFAILLYHVKDQNEGNSERTFANSWRDMISGLWNVSASADDEGYAPNLPMSEQAFRETVWDPVLAQSLKAEGDQMDFQQAYGLYLQYINSGDAEWLNDAIAELQKSPDEPVYDDDIVEGYNYETFGRNIGFVKRTGFLKNPLYGMPDSIEKYTMNNEPVNQSESSDRIAAKSSTEEEDILVVDAGLGCNVPAIHAARPQRKVDVIIVVDCEAKSLDVDSENFLSTLQVLQKQMTDNNMKFPEIDIEKLKKDPEQEYYLFEEADDPDCPIVIWFNLTNKRFRELSNANRSNEYPPQENGGKTFNDFDVTPDSPEFATTKMQYRPRDVDRLRELMRHNIGANVEVIRGKLAEKVVQLRSRK